MSSAALGTGRVGWPEARASLFRPGAALARPGYRRGMAPFFRPGSPSLGAAHRSEDNRRQSCHHREGSGYRFIAPRCDGRRTFDLLFHYNSNPADG